MYYDYLLKRPHGIIHYVQIQLSHRIEQYPNTDMKYPIGPESTKDTDQQLCTQPHVETVLSWMLTHEAVIVLPVNC